MNTKLKTIFLVALFCISVDHCYGQKNLFISGELFGKYFIPGVNIGKYFKKSEESNMFYVCSTGFWFNPDSKLLYLYDNKFEFNTGFSANYLFKKYTLGAEFGYTRYLIANNTNKKYSDYKLPELYRNMSKMNLSFNINFSFRKCKSLIFKAGSLMGPLVYGTHTHPSFVRPFIGLEYRFINKYKRDTRVANE